jgi:hypothetical protein
MKLAKVRVIEALPSQIFWSLWLNVSRSHGDTLTTSDALLPRYRAL